MRALIVCLMAVLLLPARVTAQPRQSLRVPATIALVERLPRSDAPFVVLRRAGPLPRDVILLTRDASPKQLSEAVHTLLIARQVEGDTAAITNRLRVRPNRGESPERQALPWAGRVLADLRRAAPRSIDGVGNVPAVEIWLPRQKRRVGGESIHSGSSR